MDWTDDGIVLGARRHGENAAIVTLLTRDHGRHAGLVRGGAGGATRGLLQPGNLVAAVWRARLAEHLGSYRCEMRRAHAATLMAAPATLHGLNSLVALIESTLAEREPHADLFDGTLALIEAMGGPVWLAAYVRWELALLAALGFGLDLDECAVTGLRDRLVYVSPRTGRAVSAAAGEPYRDRLLALPEFLCAGAGPGDARVAPAAVLEGLRLTGHFLVTHAFAPDRPIPATRARFIDYLSRSPTISGG